MTNPDETGFKTPNTNTPAKTSFTLENTYL